MPAWSSTVRHEQVITTVTGRPELRIGQQPTPQLDLLFSHSALQGDASSWPFGLPCLGGNLERECWQVDEVIETGQEGEVAWRRSHQLMALVSVLPDDGTDDPALLAEHAYDCLLRLARRHGHPWPLRAWNFLDHINRGRGDEERYRRFCVGRAAALERAGFTDSTLCAGTAIGSEEGVMRVQLLCGATPGIPVENPRQVSAYRYPRIHGPASPSFARATALPQADGSVLLLVSGTASVVGHASVHDGSVSAQMDETVHNLERLLSEAADRLGRRALRQAGDGSLLRAYVRHAEDWPLVRDRLMRVWPACRVAGFRGDICRRELLVEVEGVMRA
jgi:chorismate lyase / 3-hydroxybenzoate synthase